MARGFFDILKEQQDRGYGAFQASAYSPEELAYMYSQAQAGGGGFIPSNAMQAGALIGQTAGNFLGKGIGYLMSGKQRKAAAQQAASDSRARELIQQRASELASKGVPMEEAFAQASNEVFGESSEWDKASRLQQATRRVAPQMYMEAMNVGQEAKQYAPVFKTFANMQTGQTEYIDTKDREAVKDVTGRGFIPVSDFSVGWGQIGDTEFEQAYHIIPGLGKMPIEGLRRKRGTTEVNVNIGDERTESQRGIAYGEGLAATRGFQSANEILTQIEDMAETMDFSPAGVPGTTSRLVNTLEGIGEFALSIVGATEGLSPEEARTAKVYGNGEMSYRELIDPAKYTEELKNLSKAGITSSRVQAAVIELAYMMAVAEEGSARAISDNDLKLRLRTLGEGMSTKEGFQTILRDTRRRLYIKYKSLTENEPIFSNAKDEGFLRGRSQSLLEQYAPGPEAEQEPKKKPEYQIIRPGQ